VSPTLTMLESTKERGVNQVGPGGCSRGASWGGWGFTDTSFLLAYACVA
jgi:hypothetical protein